VVSIRKNIGQGILIPGGLVLTAAHCVSFSTDGAMVLGDRFVEEIGTSNGPLKLNPMAVEPVSDIAVLVALDP
jgi:hypothetical protein